MWRSFALAIGVTCILVGLECFAVEQFVINREIGFKSKPAPPAEIPSSVETALPTKPQSKIFVYKTTEETPWIFLAVGVLVISYTILLPRRFGG